MPNPILQSFFIGAALILGMFLMAVLLAIMARFWRVKADANAERYHQESLAALRERNAQWRPSQLDYCAARIAPYVMTFIPYELGSIAEVDNEATSSRAYAFARAMIDESAKHKGYLPPVPNQD